MGISSLQGAHHDPQTLMMAGPRKAFTEAPTEPSKQPSSMGSATFRVFKVVQETRVPAISVVGAVQLVSSNNESAIAIIFNENPYLSSRGV